MKFMIVNTLFSIHFISDNLLWCLLCVFFPGSSGAFLLLLYCGLVTHFIIVFKQLLMLCTAKKNGLHWAEPENIHEVAPVLTDKLLEEQNHFSNKFVKFCIPRRGAPTKGGLGLSAPPSLCPCFRSCNYW
jgi:hypothetical protein